MPVIIEPSSYETWLNGSNEMAIDLLKTYSENKMRIAYVGKNLDE
jgi:putative SOS response-associated peptidase YedK